MKGKIILNLAMSLDGFIADEEGGYDWIAGQGDKALDTEKQISFAEFLKGIDVVIMGKKSYQQGQGSYVNDYGNKKVYVATHGVRGDEGNISFVNGDIVEIALKERAAGKNIYLFGGGVLIDPFEKADLIDEYIIGVVPILLGKGRPLFLGNNPQIPLRLEAYSLEDGIFTLRYSKRS